jgi:3-oxoacyl-(acyl-carrier-protein) synthase
MSGLHVAGTGVLTGWGEGVEALPHDARAAAGARRVIPLAPPALRGERFRRATRECLLGVAAVDATLRDGGLDRQAIAGPRTALVYVTAAAYAASNRAFVDAAGGGATLHFPYTAPSAVPAEVAIEYGLTGAYVILLGGATATVDGLWQAGMLIARGQCDRALVLAVETFVECADLYARGRWLARGPLVEAAACALLVGPGPMPAVAPASETSELETLVERRAGVTLACGPLIALALARAAGAPVARVTGRWRGRHATIALAAGAPGAAPVT